jgi:hypothetical protein
MSALSSPTPVERTAIRTAYAALHSADSPNSEVVEQIVFALGAAGLLLSPESAAELERLRERVAELEAAPALPWAAQMPDGDLHGFLDDLVSAAMNRWRSEPDVPDRETLAAIEKACAEWRTPGQGFRSDDATVTS